MSELHGDSTSGSGEMDIVVAARIILEMPLKTKTSKKASISFYLETGTEQPYCHLLFCWAVLRYGKMLLVMQSSRTLREAMTKKGRCSVFRQRPFDVSATTGCCRGCLHCCVGFRSGSVIPEVCGKFWNLRAQRPFRAMKPQVEALRHFGVLGMF